MYQCLVDVDVLLLNTPLGKVPLMLAKNNKVVLDVSLVQAVACCQDVEIVYQGAPTEG